MKNKTAKQLFFGHTNHSFTLNGDKQDQADIWKNNKIGIDGGAVYGGPCWAFVFSIKRQCPSTIHNF